MPKSSKPNPILLLNLHPPLNLLKPRPSVQMKASEKYPDHKILPFVIKSYTRLMGLKLREFVYGCVKLTVEGHQVGDIHPSLPIFTIFSQ